jgi:ribonucleotide monophosphatase NagD (HAD superfamily)
MGDAVWKVLAMASGLVGARAAAKAINGTWHAATGGEPPKNPADPDVSWKEAIGFAILSGAIAGVARTIAQKQAADFYIKSAGKPPKALMADALKGEAKAK